MTLSPHSSSNLDIDADLKLIEQSGATLAQRRISGQQGDRLPGCQAISMATAMAIQSITTRIIHEHIADHANSESVTVPADIIGGWKCGMPVDDRIVLAPIYQHTLHTQHVCPVWARKNQVLIEPELAFVLRHNLPARESPYTIKEIDDAVARTHLALELLDSRYTHPEQVSFAENLADGLLNQGLWIGPEVDNSQAQLTSEMAIEVKTGNDAPTILDGRHPAIQPRAPLYWLVEFLSSQGHGLCAGQTIITGSYAGSFHVEMGKKTEIQFGDLGRLQVCFTAKVDF